MGVAPKKSGYSKINWVWQKKLGVAQKNWMWQKKLGVTI